MDSSLGGRVDIKLEIGSVQQRFLQCTSEKMEINCWVIGREGIHCQA